MAELEQEKEIIACRTWGQTVKRLTATTMDTIFYTPLWSDLGHLLESLLDLVPEELKIAFFDWYQVWGVKVVVHMCPGCDWQILVLHMCPGCDWQVMSPCTAEFLHPNVLPQYLIHVTEFKMDFVVNFWKQAKP